ncbi:MAG: M28 family peptidase [Candidatus Helarchaeota archaeon]|nr:M28 family peptidase [Candidatus Helarchaeota archaeon]
MKKLEDQTTSKDETLIKKVEEICLQKTPFEHIKAMDYPRMAGTSNGDRAVDYIVSVFKKNGFEPKGEEFYLPELSSIPKLIIPSLLIAWGIFSFCNVIFISGMCGYIFALLVLLVPIMALLVIFKLELLVRRMLKGNFQKIQRLTRKIEEGKHEEPIRKGKNVYAEYVPEEYEDHLYLTAHYDSTTLKFNMKFIKIFMIIGFLCGMIYIVCYLIHYLLLSSGFDLFGSKPTLFLVLLCVFLASVSLVLFNRIFRTNESHGAIDNLTGTTLILELARVAKLVKPKLKITFIIFAAEEIGFFGSTYHFNNREEYFESHKIHVVSIDMIGEIPPLTFISKIKPALSIPMEPTFNKEMQDLAQRLGIEFKLAKFLYPGSDFAVWLLNGHPANWVMTPSKYIHSPNDIAQNVNQQLLEDCFKLFTGYFLEKSK